MWGGRPVGKEIGEGTLQEPREHSATRGVGSEGSGDKSEQGGAGDRVGARGPSGHPGPVCRPPPPPLSRGRRFCSGLDFVPPHPDVETLTLGTSECDCV